MRSLLFFLLLALCWPVFTQNVATAVDSIQEQVSAAPAEIKPNNFFHNFDNALIMKILSVAYVIIVGLILIRIINTIIKKSLKNKMNERSKNLIVRIIQYSGLGIIVINVLKILNIDLTPLLGAAGVAGIALGFAAQTSVQDGSSVDWGGSPNGNYGDILNFPYNGGPGACCGFYNPSQDLANAFKTDANGLPLLDESYATGAKVGDPVTPYAGTLDPRIDWTIGRKGIPYLDWGNHPGDA
ncbi:MAG TPA: mechanosensitive ion channel, partial [Spirochaetales bacterium]|nr:mechanosensitive ion channel [Spirochaetales bacterium]